MSRADGQGRRWRRSALAGALVAMGAAACSDGNTAAPKIVVVPETVAIGGMPGPLSGATLPTLPEISVEQTTTSTTEPRPDPITGVLADAVLGYRVLLIGDTALAAATPRAGGILCDVVTGFGWDLEVEAERGRFIDFADEVLDVVSADDWDVVGLMFGHHLRTTVDDFERRLDAVLDRLGSRPIVLYTVAETGADQVEVNRIIRERQRSRPNVVVIDWAEAANAEPDALLQGGGPVPTPEGAGRLALFTAALLSEAPGDEPGTCLEPIFTDDSAIVL